MISRGDFMFKIRHTEESINKTFRFPLKLVDKMSEIAQSENVSLNNFVIQCCEYAIEHLDKDDEE